ncbi:MAG: ATP-binding protein [Verrucomicrobiota bacterium]
MLISSGPLGNIEEILNTFQDESGGPGQILIHATPQGDYNLLYINSDASKIFDMPRIGIRDPHLHWQDIPQSLATYLHEIFANINADEAPSSPIFELEDRSFSVTFMKHREDHADGIHYWFFFCFNEITSWISLQEEVMNARRLESIGGLASGVAHDFNNLILAIQGYAEYLTMTKNHDAETKKALQQIMQACANGTSLTRSLLGYSRRQSLSMGNLNLAELVHDVINLTRRSYGPRYQLKIDETISNKDKTDAPQIYGCYSALSHTFLNILNNARDSMKDGGIIHITHEKDSEYIYLSITDEGSGISPEHIKKIFEPFYTTKDKGAGTGLGLSLVQGIMQQHGGMVGIESKIDRGTTVKLGWPHYHEMNQGDDSNSKVATQSIVKAKVQPPPPVRPGDKPDSAFLIEDDPIVLGSVNSLLKLQKIRAHQFSSPSEALEEIGLGNYPSLIIVDYTMPEMDGKQFIRSAYEIFKSFDEMPSVRIILMSGYPPEHFDEFIEECTDFPIYLIQKPFSYQTLESLISTRQKRFLRKITTRVQIDPQKLHSIRQARKNAK